MQQLKHIIFQNLLNESRIWGCATQICKHGPHFARLPRKEKKTKQNPETWVKFVKNQVKNCTENFGKWVYSLSKRYSKITQTD